MSKTQLLSRRTRPWRMALTISASLLGIAACGSDEKRTDESAAVTSAAVSDSSATTSPASTSTEADTTATDAPTTDTMSSETMTSETMSSDAGTTSAAGPFSVDADNGTVTLDERPTKIISLSATHTETLFAIGAGDQVIAVDDQSDYPPEVEDVKSDLSGYTPNVEAIAGYEPDLVIVGGDFTGLGEQLAAVGIPVWSGDAPETIDGAYDQIEQLGVLTGHVAEAAGVVADMQTEIEKILLDVPQTEEPLTFYHELDNTYYSIRSETFIGEVYSLAGLRNIADQAEVADAYVQLSAELIISANPDLIFLADSECCGESSETVAARDGWGDIAAVQNGNVFSLEDDLASRWGPRTVDFLRAVVDSVAAVTVPVG